MKMILPGEVHRCSEFSWLPHQNYYSPQWHQCLWGLKIRHPKKTKRWKSSVACNNFKRKRPLTTLTVFTLEKLLHARVPLRPVISSINTPHHTENYTDFTSKVCNLALNPEDTIVSFDVASLFTCTPTAEAVVTSENNYRKTTPYKTDPCKESP